MIMKCREKRNRGPSTGTPPQGDRDIPGQAKYSRKFFACINQFRYYQASGEKMTYAEFEKLILLSDRMISSCVPGKSEYWRGYNSGIKFHFQNGRQEALPDHYFIVEIARREGSRDVHAYAHGYRDGCNGLIPEDIP